jgi:hypothetical protein
MKAAAFMLVLLCSSPAVFGRKLLQDGVSTGVRMGGWSLRGMSHTCARGPASTHP